MSSIFKGVARRSGNSLIVTIPKGVAEGLEIKNGSDLKVTIQKVEKGN